MEILALFPALAHLVFSLGQGAQWVKPALVSEQVNSNPFDYVVIRALRVWLKPHAVRAVDLNRYLTVNR
jgi:hypothetical protein